MYRLYIINDDFNRRERVIEVLLKTVQGLSFASAYASMDEAHKYGKGHVTTVVQELAEHYCETNVRRASLVSSSRTSKRGVRTPDERTECSAIEGKLHAEGYPLHSFEKHAYTCG